MIDDRNLDALLSAPLADVADAGFTAHVIQGIERKELWGERVAWGVPALAACALAPFLPVQELTRTLVHLGPAIAGSAALSLGAAVLVLTVSLEQHYREWQAGAL